MFLRVAWLDQNGPCNVGTINGTPAAGRQGFELRTKIGNAPTLILEISRGAISLGLEAEGVAEWFTKCAEDEMKTIAPLVPIISIEKAWAGIAEDVRALIANDGRPVPNTAQMNRESIYDQRGKPAYDRSAGNHGWNPDWHKNPHILKWWTDAHDQLLAQRIQEEQWIWSARVFERIVAVTPPEVIAAWKAEDPICSTYTGPEVAQLDGVPFAFRYVWYNVLTRFVESRANSLGLTAAIRQPERRHCPLCGEIFVEDSLPVPLVQRLGINQLDFCAPCLRDTVLQGSGSNTASKEQIRSYLRDMAAVLQHIPSQDFGEGMYDLRDMSTDERLAILRELRKKPSLRRVKDLFGSWFKALIDAELLENEARRTSFGTQCLAKDGHMCFSLGEKTIDDLLHAVGIPHEREPFYPDSNYRADFIVDGIFIEYFGLVGDADYDAKSSEKQKLCRAHSIKLISIFPNDLVSSRKLENMLLKGLGLPVDE
jgi:hypothetical protein